MKVPWTFFRLPFCSCLCDTRHRLCLFCNILLSLKYKKIMHAIMHSKLKEPVGDKVWRQHFHQRENFINKHKNPFSFNNITDLWNIWIKLFSPCLNIYVSFTLDLEYFFELNFPVFITDYYGEHHSVHITQTAFLPDEIKLKDMLPACTQRTPTSRDHSVCWQD